MSFLSALGGIAGPIIGGLFNRSAQRRDISNQNFWNERQEAFQNRWNAAGLAWQKEQYHHGIRARVEDARRAGIHPLYALGSPGVGASPWSASGFNPVPGQSASGSHLGAGIASAAQNLAAWVGERDAREFNKPLRDAQVQRERAAARRENAEADEIRSRAKRAEQRANETRGPRSGDGAAVYPLSSGVGPALKMRALRAEPRTSWPAESEIIWNDGTRDAVVNPEIAEELSQLQILGRGTKRMFDRQVLKYAGKTRYGGAARYRKIRGRSGILR